jgi:peptidoglycan/LPS O-acetylase OafA/YrhL
LAQLSTPKPHYLILDALRGIAAILVVVFHLFEAHTLGDHQNQIINHGYLAVDFFFMLSGFVMGYAYDDRWGTMTLAQFFKIRLIRLQPLVVVGTLVGAALFSSQDSGLFPNIHQVPLWHFLFILAIGGWGELHPLNGPGWSLFYEYVANILYAVWIRRWSNTALGGLVVVSAGAVVWLAVFGPAGEVSGGWSLNAEQIRIGITRVMYPFFAGLLLCRMARLRHISGAFFWSSALLVVIIVWPRVGGQQLWLNGIYEAVCILFLFPLVVYLGACGRVAGAGLNRLCTFLGAISYPLYITHYPLIYSYTAWATDNKVTATEGWPWGVATLALSLALAYTSLKLYDEPIRRWLRAKLLYK